VNFLLKSAQNCSIILSAVFLKIPCYSCSAEEAIVNFPCDCRTPSGHARRWSRGQTASNGSIETGRPAMRTPHTLCSSGISGWTQSNSWLAFTLRVLTAMIATDPCAHAAEAAQTVTWLMPYVDTAPSCVTCPGKRLPSRRDARLRRSPYCRLKPVPAWPYYNRSIFQMPRVRSTVAAIMMRFSTGLRLKISGPIFIADSSKAK